MAAPIKEGIDYFPHTIGLLKERKFRSLKLKYGCIVIVIYLALLEMIYSDKGYYIEYETQKDDIIWDVLEYLQGQYQPTAETVSDVIDGLVACGLFSDDHYPEIITSKRIQEVYYSATVERKTINVIARYWLLSVKEMETLSSKSFILKFIQSQTINDINRPNNEVIRPNNSQSKVEESKVEESKEKQLTPVGASTCDSSIDKKPMYHKHGVYGRIMLTDEQYDKLVAEFGQAQIDKQINSLDEYVQSNNNKNGYKDYNLVLRKSLRENWFGDKKSQSEQCIKPKNNVGLDL